MKSFAFMVVYHMTSATICWKCVMDPEIATFAFYLIDDEMLFFGMEIFCIV
jgi:hypothetical protein